MEAFNAATARQWKEMPVDQSEQIKTDVTRKAQACPRRARQPQKRAVGPDDSATDASSTFGIGSSSTPIVPDAFDSSVSKVEQYDNKPGAFSGGLQRMSRSAVQFVEERLGDSAYTAMAINKNHALDKLTVAKARQRDKTCHQLHPGLCRTAHVGIILKVKRLGKQLYKAMFKMKGQPGFGLYFVQGFGMEVHGHGKAGSFV